jgi:hypothetical protein
LQIKKKLQQESHQLLDVMVQTGNQPNKITYNTLIMGFARWYSGKGQGDFSRDFGEMLQA